MKRWTGAYTPPRSGVQDRAKQNISGRLAPLLQG